MYSEIPISRVFYYLGTRYILDVKSILRRIEAGRLAHIRKTPDQILGSENNKGRMMEYFCAENTNRDDTFYL